MNREARAPVAVPRTRAPDAEMFSFRRVCPRAEAPSGLQQLFANRRESWDAAATVERHSDMHTATMLIPSPKNRDPKIGSSCRPRLVHVVLALQRAQSDTYSTSGTRPIP